MSTSSSRFFNATRLTTIVFALAVLFIGTAPAFAAGPLAPNSGITVNTSRNWAGYVAKGNTYSGVSGSWTIPNVTPTTNMSADVTWVGIGGAASTDLIQAGTQAISQNGQVTYQAWYELLPGSSNNVPLVIHPGDHISASIARQGTTNYWLITLTNNSTNQSYSATVFYNSSLSSAEWIEEMPSDQSYSFIPLDSFTDVPFSNAQAVVNGVSENLVSLGAYPVTMTSSSQVLASPSAIGTDNDSFTVTHGPSPVNVYQTPVSVNVPLQPQSSSTVYYVSPGNSVRVTRYFVVPTRRSFTSGTTQTFTFGSGSITIRVSM